MTGTVLAVTGGGLLRGHTETFTNVFFGEEEICSDVWGLNPDEGLCLFG